MERVRINPASPTYLKKTAPEFMEKASVSFDRSLSPGSMALRGWMQWITSLQFHDRSTGAGH